MPRMKREDAQMLIERMNELKPTGTRTALHQAMTPLLSFVVRETTYTLKSAPGWLVPGLFVAYDDIKKAIRSNIVILYKMGCGTILSLVLPKLPNKKFPSHLTVLEAGKVYRGEAGVKIGIENWVKVGSVYDFIEKKGPIKTRHLARKPLLTSEHIN
jgi:hypothetical protein